MRSLGHTPRLHQEPQHILRHARPAGCGGGACQICMTRYGLLSLEHQDSIELVILGIEYYGGGGAHRR